MKEVLDFFRPFPSEDRWDACFVLAEDYAPNPMGRGITYDICQYSQATPQQVRGIELGSLMILKATSGILLLHPVEKDCVGGRHAVVLIAVFCCMG